MIGRNVNFRMKWQSFSDLTQRLYQQPPFPLWPWKQGQQIIPTIRTRNFLARRHQKRKSEGRQNHPLRRWSSFWRKLKMINGKRSWKIVTISKNAQRENVYNESIPRHFVKKGRLRTYSCIYVHFLNLRWGDCFSFRKNKQLCCQEWSTFIFQHFCRTLPAQRELLLSTAAKYCDHRLLSFVLEFGLNWWTVRVLFFCYSVAALVFAVLHN